MSSERSCNIAWCVRTWSMVSEVKGKKKEKTMQHTFPAQIHPYVVGSCIDAL